jgi:glucose/arabinose dehydrogenase
MLYNVTMLGDRILKLIASWKVRLILFLSVSLIYSSAIIAFTLKEFDAFSPHGFKQAATLFVTKSNVFTTTVFRDYRSLELSSAKYTSQQEYRLIERFQTDFENISSGELPNVISKIPAQVPKTIRSCANSIGLNGKLISVNLIRFNSKNQYLFVNQSKLNPSGLKFSIVDENCDSLFSENWLKTSKAFLRIREFSTSLESLPGHFAIFKDSAYLLDRYANLYTFKISEMDQRVNFTRSAKIVLDPKMKLKDTLNIQGAGVKGVHINRGILYFSVAGEADGCLKLNVYQVELPKDDNDSPRIPASLFYSGPSCYSQGTANLGGSGGKMITSLDKSSMILSLGNASIWTGNENIAIDRNIGNILAINYESGAANLISTGHRNPQGLCVFKGQLFSTEQGPEGGDEFNIILSGGDYGWPFVTLGHPYGNSVDPAARTRSFAIGSSIAPIFSWSPSIASGDLECPTSEGVEPWDDSFLVATLRDMSIRRLSLYQNRVISDERIPLSKRIRNIERSGKEDFLLLSDDGTLLELHLLSLVNKN